MNEINTKSFQVSKYYEIGYYQRDQNIFGSYPNNPDEFGARGGDSERRVEAQEQSIRHVRDSSYVTEDCGVWLESERVEAGRKIDLDN